MTLGLRDLGYTSRGDWFTRSSELLSQLGFETGAVGTGQENLLRGAELDADADANNVADGWEAAGDTTVVTLNVTA